MTKNFSWGLPQPEVSPCGTVSIQMPMPSNAETLMALFQQSITTIANEFSKLFVYAVTATQANNVGRINEGDMEKETWDNTLKEYGDVLTTKDLCAIFGRERQTISKWRKEGRITPINSATRPQYRKDDIKKYYLKLHQPL